MTRDVYPMQGAETRLVVETSYGVTPGSPTYKRVNGVGLMLSPAFEINTFAPPGAMVPTSPLVDDDFSEGSLDGVVDFNGLIYVFSSLFGWAQITSLGGGPTAYQYLWTWNGRRPNRAASYTCHYGFPDSADTAAGVIINNLTLSGGRGDGFDVSGDAFGKAMSLGVAMGGITNEVQTITITGTPTGGNFTLTLDGFTTSNLLFSSTAAQVQTALEALPNLDSGDVVVTGGPGPGTPYVATFGGTLAGVDVSLMVAAHTFTGGASPNITVVQTTQGADAVVDVPAVPAGAVTGDAYLDTTFAGLGTTQLLQLMSMEVAFDDRMSRVRPINSTKSSDAIIDESDQEHTVTLTLAKNAVLDAQLAKLRAGTLSFVRAQWTGATISGANKYLLQIDMPVFWQDLGAASDTDNVFTRDLEGRVVIDPTSNTAVRIKMVTGLSTL